MKVELNKITVRELTKNYKDNKDGGVVGYDGKLDIRPPYQREFVYKDNQRDAVLQTVNNGFPLNVMYWALKTDGTYEIIDGQQRTISLCQYVDNDFSINGMAFHNLTKEQQNKILDYELTVYICEGSEGEKLDWFRTINIAGEQLTNQELRNAVYSGSWVTDAKRYFSKKHCVASKIAKDYLSGSAIRQDYLETAIKWISNNKIEDYMSKNQHNKDAEDLWLYFESVIEWVESLFKVKRKFMKGIDWGMLYNKYKTINLDPNQVEIKVKKLLFDDDVTNKKGIYKYIITNNEKHLSIRTFSINIKQKVYEKQNGVCPVCNKYFDLKDMEADHIIPWSKGGSTNESNCQLLCIEDNRSKSNK